MRAIDVKEDISVVGESQELHEEVRFACPPKWLAKSVSLTKPWGLVFQ